MKLSSLSEKLLTFAVKSKKSFFDFSDFTDAFPDVDVNLLESSIDILNNRGYLLTTYADDIPYSTQILPEGIEYVEKNNLLNKVYNVVKEINSFR